jgi:hypothetical protein
MNEAWIDSLDRRIRERDTSLLPSKKVQLKKRLDVLRSRLSISSANARSDSVGSYHSPWYVSQTDPLSLIIDDYDRVLTDIYTHLSYLHLLDYYTKTHTHNRGYYCRKRSYTRIYLMNTYDPHSYCFRDAAWEWFFLPPTKRPPLHSYLFNYIISLQDDERK